MSAPFPEFQAHEIAVEVPFTPFQACRDPERAWRVAARRVREAGRSAFPNVGEWPVVSPIPPGLATGLYAESQQDNPSFEPAMPGRPERARATALYDGKHVPMPRLYEALDWVVAQADAIVTAVVAEDPAGPAS